MNLPMKWIFQSPFLASQSTSAEERQECPEGFLAGPATCGSCPFASSERCLVRTYENGYLNFRAPLGVSFCKVEISPGCNNRLQRAPKELQTCKAKVLIFEDLARLGK